MENTCSSFSRQWQKWPGKGAGWECRAWYVERHFLPLSPLLRGIVNCSSDLQPVLLEQRSPKMIPSQERLRGQGLRGASRVDGRWWTTFQPGARAWKTNLPPHKSFSGKRAAFVLLLLRGFWACSEFQLLWAGVGEGCTGLSCHGAAFQWHADVMSWYFPSQASV